MIALYIIAGIIIFFALILSFNASLYVNFSSANKESMNIYAKIGFYKIYITPGKPKKKKKIEKVIKEKKKKEKSEKIRKKKKEEEKPEKEKKKLNIPAIIELVKDISSKFWKKIRKFLKFKIYKINVIVASKDNDAYKTATLYGSVIQSAYYLYELIDNNFKVSRKSWDNIKITPDFLKESLAFDVNIKIYIKLGHILNIGFSAAISFVKFMLKSKGDKNKDKNKKDKSETEITKSLTTEKI